MRVGGDEEQLASLAIVRSNLPIVPAAEQGIAIGHEAHAQTFRRARFDVNLQQQFCRIGCPHANLRAAARGKVLALLSRESHARDPERVRRLFADDFGKKQALGRQGMLGTVFQAQHLSARSAAIDVKRLRSIAVTFSTYISIPQTPESFVHVFALRVVTHALLWILQALNVGLRRPRDGYARHRPVAHSAAGFKFKYTRTVFAPHQRQTSIACTREQTIAHDRERTNASRYVLLQRERLFDDATRNGYAQHIRARRSQIRVLIVLIDRYR